jgi:chaperonin cofactor prefoldin
MFGLDESFVDSRDDEETNRLHKKIRKLKEEKSKLKERIAELEAMLNPENKE